MIKVSVKLALNFMTKVNLQKGPDEKSRFGVQAKQGALSIFEMGL